jgi:hypothetical protein
MVDGMVHLRSAMEVIFVCVYMHVCVARGSVCVHSDHDACVHARHSKGSTYICMHIHVHTSIHTYIYHTCMIPAHVRALGASFDPHTHAHTHIHMHTHARTHTHTHIYHTYRVPAHVRALGVSFDPHTHAHTHTYTHTYTYIPYIQGSRTCSSSRRLLKILAHMHTHTHTHTHYTHIHTHIHTIHTGFPHMFESLAPPKNPRWLGQVPNKIANPMPMLVNCPRSVLHQCMYVCVYVCMYVCMYICMYVSM